MNDNHVALKEFERMFHKKYVTDSMFDKGGD